MNPRWLCSAASACLRVLIAGSSRDHLTPRSSFCMVRTIVKGNVSSRASNSTSASKELPGLYLPENP